LSWHFGVHFQLQRNLKKTRSGWFVSHQTSGSEGFDLPFKLTA
jgi:hypothetical protein